MSSRHDDLNRQVAEQLEERRVVHLANLAALRARQGREVTEDDQYLAAMLACRNRRERRKAGLRNEHEPRAMAVPRSSK